MSERVYAPEDIAESRILNAPENKPSFESYDIYRNLSPREKREMREAIEKDTVRFAAEFDEKLLPSMPKGKLSSIRSQRQFLGIIAERKARLNAQSKWLKEQQEYYRQLREE